MRLFTQTASEIVGGIEIEGGADFRARTREALELLEGREAFAEVKRSIAVIREGRRSGMRARKRRPTFVVGGPTWRHSALWYAGAIAHDACHSRLYREARSGSGGKEPDRDAWTGAAAEKKCLAFQRRVLEELQADAATLAYLRGCESGPVYQGANRGLRSWLDYLARRW